MLDCLSWLSTREVELVKKAKKRPGPKAPPLDVERGCRMMALRKMMGFKSKAALGIEVGVTGQAVGQWEQGREITDVHMRTLERVAGVPLRPWLYYAEGKINEMPLKKYGDKNDKNMSSSATSGSEHKDMHPGTDIEMGKRNEDEEEFQDLPQISRDLMQPIDGGDSFDVPFAGGKMKAVAVTATWKIPEEQLRPRLLGSSMKNIVVVDCEGDSMQPTIDSGDKVFVDISKTEPVPSGVFAINDGTGIALKRLSIVDGSKPRRVNVMYDNPLQRGIESVPLSDVIIVGRYVAKLKLTLA